MPGENKPRSGRMGVGEGLILTGVVRESVMFEQRHEGVSQVDMGKPAPDRGDSCATLCCFSVLDREVCWPIRPRARVWCGIKSGDQGEVEDMRADQG